MLASSRSSVAMCRVLEHDTTLCLGLLHLQLTGKRPYITEKKLTQSTQTNKTLYILHLFPYLTRTCKSSKCYGDTSWMCRLAWAFANRWSLLLVFVWLAQSLASRNRSRPDTVPCWRLIMIDMKQCQRSYKHCCFISS